MKNKYTNFELAKKLSDLAMIMDEDKANIPNGDKYTDELHEMAKVIAGDRVKYLYGEDDKPMISAFSAEEE